MCVCVCVCVCVFMYVCLCGIFRVKIIFDKHLVLTNTVDWD